MATAPKQHTDIDFGETRSDDRKTPDKSDADGDPTAPTRQLAKKQNGGDTGEHRAGKNDGGNIGKGDMGCGEKIADKAQISGHAADGVQANSRGVHSPRAL
jgi:hypothetical protein